MKKAAYAISGFIAGALNGLLGAGGGMVIVPMLKKQGLSAQKAHATSVCIILPICIFSAASYLYNGKTTIGDAVPFLGWGLLGGLIGSFILPRINQVVLQKIFGAFMIWASIRMLLN